MYGVVTQHLFKTRYGVINANLKPRQEGEREGGVKGMEADDRQSDT